MQEGGEIGNGCLRTDLVRLLGGWPAPTTATPGTSPGGAPRPSPHSDDGAEAPPVDTGLPRDGDTGRAIVESVAMPPTRRTPNDDTRALPGVVVRPPGPGPFPAVLYCHAHGHDYTIGKRELVDGRRALPAGPYGPALAARGILSLCIDQPGFDARAADSESSLAKRFLWHGDTLFGSMLRELAAALDHLAARDDVDASRIATLGISMGASTAWWLAALDERVAAVAELCCLADVGELVRADAHDAHGIYLTVPGLLARCRTADVAGLICPRPHLVGIGDRDPLTPPAAVDAVLEPLARRYAAAGRGDALEIVRSADTGHVETPAMRAAVLDFLARRLAPRSAPPARDE